MDIKISGAYARRLPNGKWQAQYNAAPLGERITIKAAGTWKTEEEALRIAATKRLRVLSESSAEHDFDPSTTLAEYVPYFLKVHQVELITKSGYQSALNAHVLPTFGNTRFADLHRQRLRIWIEDMREDGVTDTTIRRARVAFSALLTSACNEGLIEFNPMHGIRIPKPVRNQIRIINPSQFERLWAALETDARRLFLEVQIETGCRLNEVLPLTPEQLNAKTRIVTINRGHGAPGKKWTKDGDRFTIKPYPKNRKPRRIEISQNLMDRLCAFVDLHEIAPTHVIFNRSRMGVGKPGAHRSKKDMPLTPDVIESLGWITRGNSRYRHGNETGYRFCKMDDGKACEYCRTASRQAARRRRENVTRGQDKATWITERAPEKNVCPPDRWRDFFYTAVESANIGFRRGELHAYHMRHAHASWLIRQGGVDPFFVMERLDHKDMSTLKLYVPEPEEEDDPTIVSPAVAAMNRLRGRA